MPDIYDPERGLKIGLTDDDYDDYQKGNLSDDFYARRTDGSIANKVDISRLDDSDEYEEPSNGIDAGSAAIGGLIVAAIIGAGYGIKKLWDRHKVKKTEAQVAKQRKAQVNLQEEENIQMAIEPTDTVVSTDAVQSNDAERRSLTQEEAIQELMKIVVGMAELLMAGKRFQKALKISAMQG